MLQTAQNHEFHVAGAYQALMRIVGLDAEAIFDHPDIVCWRGLPDRENCTLDADLPDGRHVRLHVKRYAARCSSLTPADEEARGHRLLVERNVPTAPLVGWGRLADGRSFVLFEDLAGYRPADKLIGAGRPFEALLAPTAELAARLHRAGLHHRDLYLCHFMAPVDGEPAGLRLIDPARVRRLPHWSARRWIIKDLAQFWYSTLRLGITDEQRLRWLDHYAQCRELAGIALLRRGVSWKARAIARHDARLHRHRPERDVSIPHA